MATLVETPLGDNFGMIKFKSIIGVNFYATYHPLLTTVKQIKKTLENNYVCTGVNTTTLGIILIHEKKKITLNTEDENNTIGNICESYDIPNDNTIVKNIEIRDLTGVCNDNDKYKYKKLISDDLKNEIAKNGYEIFVSTLTGSVIDIRVLSNMTVETLKMFITLKEGIPPNQQRLICSGKQLEDDKTMDYYDITYGRTLHLVLRLRGGMYHETSGKNGNFQPLQDIVFVIEPDLVDPNLGENNNK